MKRSLLLLVLLLAACGQSGSSSSQPPEDPPAVPDEPAGPAGPRVSRQQFDLVAETDGPLRAGQLAQVKITLTGKNGWHVNQEFPVTVDLTAPANATLAKAHLERSDATAFEEARFVFSAPLTPTAAGNAEVRATVSFAVCTDENCAPYTENLALTAPVM